jgi:hypothetical protein
MSANSPEFDWYPDSDDNDHCVVLRHQLGIAVYLNHRDDVVIRQQEEYGDEDYVIYVNKDNVLKLVERLLAKADSEAKIVPTEDIAQLASSSEKVRPKDPTAAERMRRYRKNKRRNDRNGDVTPVADELDGEPHD